MTTHTIPGQLFLLLTNDAGRQDSTYYRQQALAAAAITELTLYQRVALTEERTPKVTVLDHTPLGLPVLDQALGALAGLDGKPIGSVIGHRSMDLTEVIGEGFAAVGVVQRKDGWFTTSWPTHDDTYENSLRARIAGAVRDPRTASLQDGVLLELLRTLGVAHRILGGDLPELSRKELDQRIEGLDVDHPAALAVKKMMNDMTAVMIATTTATTIMT
ncbi:MAG: GOLPH3/VPS74 family protein [Brachybacterium sp.]|uniref:GOLPH3/VPS74 family protein n=1 Tax=Brachybacterium sp. Z12 TaxID=2759167 RepID=UPI0018616932|nr:GPP34 family phosphoprotein [Brachybacterium sp. Z12]QNN82751.1 GPP34 family phosphoprotein [Brachybacterium sp. Z12]